MRHFLLAMTFIVIGMGLTSCATTSSDTVYLIKLEEGDTLSKIATKYDTTWQKIASLNNIKPGSSIKVGTVLRIMPGPGGLIARKSSSGIFFRGANQAENEDSYPDMQEDADGHEHRGLFFGSKAGQLNWPVYGKITSVYGMRGRKFHHGIDIGAKRGTIVYSAANGTVEFSGRQHGYGNIVIVRHGNYKTAYAHLRKISVRRGQRVAAHTVIGEVGTTGNSRGPHLHFEVRSLADKSVDPYSMLDTKQLLSEK